ncbi:protein PIN-LIKES 3 [Glycine max]|uniref:protein PIN-LIKES 3 n=1 Tax=Glycine max TaxID=3847 RepID=UPI000719350B|nr:protein PIN-LIKES 3 [Glycine max]|eukprot:XP_014628042.1 protein PIN-LIKES 3 [Glycine max]
MKVLEFILALILVLAVVHVQPNLAVRVLNMKEQLNLMSLDKGPVTPSGPSTCTYIPGTGGKNCPPLEEMNVAGNYVQHHSDETYPRLVVPFGPVSAIETDLENHSAEPVVTAEDLSQANDHVPKQKQIMKPLKPLVQKLNLKVLLATATIGSILGLIIGVVPPFQKMFVGDDAPLGVIEDSASMLGDASIPAITLLLGANLLNGLKRSGMKLSLVVRIIIVRYIVLPILGVAIVKGAIHFGIIQHDPLYQFILLLQYALPPAISISTITQLFGAGETKCSIVMLATYVCASFSLTLWSTFRLKHD